MHILYSRPGPRVKKILALAAKAAVSCECAGDAVLDERVKSLPVPARDHRGIVLCVQVTGSSPARNAVDFDWWLAERKSGRCTVVILDSVTDPHNVGAVLRSCDQFGVSLLVTGEHRSMSDVGVNEVISRTSAGANAWVPFCVVKNLVRTVEQLKAAGFWVYGADAGGTPVQKLSFPEKTVLVMGSEGNGIARLLGEQCDTVVSIPTCGKVDSLNVSVAAGVLLYELYRQRLETDILQKTDRGRV
jgi:23S rRNA (guanosine2251-2'-O)-methyltransferase